MNTTIQNHDIAKETLSILAYFEPNLINKIPNNVLKKLGELAADSNAEFYINIEENLDKQNISEESKDLISLIYYNYIADSDEKNRLWNLWNENEKNYQEKLIEKYDSDKIFQNKVKNFSNEKDLDLNNTSIVKYKKKNIFHAIINFIKNKLIV